MSPGRESGGAGGRKEREGNLEAALESVAGRSVEPGNLPTHAFIEVTTRCNLKCIQCNRVYVDGYIDGTLEGDISLATVKKLEPVIPRLTSLTATGFGEPFMNPEIIPILRWLSSFGVSMGMISNGMLLDEEAAREIIALGLEEIWFSLDSPDPDTFRHIRVGAELEKVKENVARLARMRDAAGGERPRIAVEFVAMARNFLQLPGMPELARDLGCYKVVVQKLFNSPDPGYSRFYRRNNLGNVEVEAGLAAWREFREGMERCGLELESYLGEDPTPLFRRETPPAPAGTGGYPEFLGCLDGPAPFASALGRLPYLGWVQGRERPPRAVLVLEGGGGSFSWPLAPGDPRPDVVQALPDAYLPEEGCGFSGEIDLARVPPGEYSLFIRVENGTSPEVERISPRTLYVNMEKDMRMYCTQPWSTLFVTREGKVKPCCFSDLVLGDLGEQGILEIWRGEKARGLRRSVIEGRVHPYCVDCVNSGYPVDYLPRREGDGGA